MADDFPDAEGSGHHVQENKAPEHGKPAEYRDQQRFLRPVYGPFPVMPEGDQQERGDAGQLPEAVEHHQIVRQHHSQHGAHKQQQIDIEEAEGFLGFVQIKNRIQGHKRTHTCDQKGKQQGQTVQIKLEVYAKRRYPRYRSADRLTLPDAGKLQQKINE
ncbi:hypothetical protein D3C75_564730 [compost metagenome]